MLKLPKLLDIPPKLYSFLTSFNSYLYFLIEGGRGSAKTQSVARFLLYICEKRKVRICCGREFQANIDESVKAVLVDLINLFNLNFAVYDKKIVHRATGSVIFFKGFREQGSVNIKGLEGVDILWIEEAQSISKPTLDIITPTIRKNNSKIIFTMNRYVRNDPVYRFCTSKNNCLHIKINYFDNPYCPQKLKDEAVELKQANYKDYKHIWLGEPLEQANDFLISSNKIELAKTLNFNPDRFIRKLKVMAVDMSGCGGDLNVAKLVENASSSGWLEANTEKWSEPDTDVTIGKIINLYSIWKPDILILDADGMGYPIYISVKKAIPDCIGFRGAGKARLQNSANQRADGYLTLADFLIHGWLKITCENSSRQLEYIKKKYSKNNGLILIQSKEDIRKEQGESPDFADCLMMCIYAIAFYSYLFHKNLSTTSLNSQIETDFNPFD